MRKPIHVLHVLEATEGGTRRWIEDVLLGLDHNRVRASLICSNRRDSTFATSIATFKNAGINVEEISMDRNIHPASDLKGLQSIRRLIESIQPTLVHAHSSKAGALCRIANRLCETRRLMVYTPHGFSFLGNSRLSRIYRLIERMCIPFTDRLLAVSNSEKQTALSLGFPPEQIDVIENGTSIDAFGPHRPRNRRVTIGTLSGLRPQKDPLTLLEAFVLAAREEPEIHLRICGVGPLENSLKTRLNNSLVRDRVDLPGRIPDGKRELKQWDIFALSSLFEGLPYSLLEAMAAGVPLVATRVPGVVDVIEDGVNGLLVPPNDPKSLADALLRLIRDSGLRFSLAESGRETIRNRFRLDIQLERLARYYESFAGES